MEENIDIVKAKIASAQQQQEAGNLTTAIVLYQEILDEFPNNADALHYLGLAYYQAKKYDMILPLLTRAIELDPTSMYMHENNLIIFKNLNLVNLITTELHWLASAKPNDMALQEQLITAYQQQTADYSFISAI
ncbi:MAG: tetratricopeptide repeat protein, partial [Gammaproteobacteria bacterium]